MWCDLMNLRGEMCKFSLFFFLSSGPAVNVTCNIFINSFGSITETTMVRRPWRFQMFHMLERQKQLKINIMRFKKPSKIMYYGLYWFIIVPLLWFIYGNIETLHPLSFLPTSLLIHSVLKPFPHFCVSWSITVQPSETNGSLTCW